LILFSIIIYYFAQKNLKKDKKIINKYRNVDFIKIDFRFLFSKIFEIFFQQLMVFILIKILNNLGFNLTIIILVFIFLFGLSHLFLIKINKKMFGLFYTLVGILSAFIIPYIILNINYGIIITFIIHYLFYIFAGVLFWIIKPYKLLNMKGE
jgi:hypothetical protein